MKSNGYGAIRRVTVLGVCALALMILPGTSVWATARAIGARSLSFISREIAPAFGGSSALTAPSISASMAAVISTDNGTPGKANAGDVIRYTTTITNNGTDATGVHLEDTIDTHTTFAAGSVVVSPLAANDTYVSVGNMTLTSSSIGADCTANILHSVTCNDTLNSATLTTFGDTQAHAGNTTVNGTNTVTTAHGTVTLDTEGRFVYNPNAGYEGTDTFWYTLANTSVTPNLTDTGQVTITIGGVTAGVKQMVWFVNSTGAAGTGSQASPFNSLAAFAAVNDGTGTHPEIGDTIYLFENSTAFTGPVTLLQNQRFIGQDATLSPASLNGPATQPGNAYPPNNPSTDTVTIASSATAASTLTAASGTTLAGFTIGTTGAGQFAISATTGSLSVRDVVIDSDAGGLSLNQTSVVGTAPFTGFTSVTSRGGTNGVKLLAASGTLALGTGALSGASGATVSVAGGSATVTYGGSLTQNTASSSVLDVLTLSTVSNTGTMTFSGSVHSLAPTTIGMQFNGANGTYTFSGAVLMTAPVTLTNNCNGSFNFTNTGTSITNPTGPAFSVSGGTGSIDYNGTISKTLTSGTVIDIQNKTGGTVSFDGSVSTSGSSSGINLQNNTGATFAFTGGLTLNTSTTGTTGFNATGGGTVTVTGSGNTITSGTGRALNVVNTTIGANHLTFKSISAGVTASGPINAIVLNTTGTSGHLSVTGAGSVTQGGDFSGGTIQHTTGAGIALTSTTAPSFNNMRIQTTAGSGVDGTGVHGFTFTNGTIDKSGLNDALAVTGGSNTSNIGFNQSQAAATNNIDGTLTITNNILNEALYHGIQVFNRAGTIDNATVSNNSVTSTTSTSTSLGQGIHLVAFGTAGSVASITKATIAGNTITNIPVGVGLEVQGGNSTSGPAGFLGAPGNPTNIISITGNTITGASAANHIGSEGIVASVQGGNAGSPNVGNFDISSNTITNVGGFALSHSTFGDSTVTSTVTNNIINAHNPANSGSGGIGLGTSSTVGSSDTPSMTATITGNNIHFTDGNGILAVARDAHGTLEVKINGNTVGVPNSEFEEGIRVDSGNGNSSNETVHLEMTGNTTTGSFSPSFGLTAPGIGVRKQGTSATVNVFGLEGLSPSPATAAQMEVALGALNPNSSQGSAGASHTGNAERADVISGSNFVSAVVPLLVAAGGVEPARALTATADRALEEADLDAILPAARNRWHAVGPTASQTDALAASRLRVQDLPDSYIGAAVGGHLSLSRDAAGHDWFIDSSPLDDAEFTRAASATRLYTTPDGAPAGRLDLLTAVLHEMGHELGLPDTYADADRDSLMYGRLTTGERRLPSAGLLASLASSPTGMLRQALSLFRAPDRRVRHQSQSAMAGLPRGPSIESHGSQPTLVSRVSSRLGAWAGAAVSASRAGVRDAGVLALHAVDALSAPLHASGETVSLDFGSLPAGKKITVVYDVTVDTPPVASYSNHATISSTTSSFSSVDSNTVTTDGDLYNTTTAIVSSQNPIDQGLAITVTATVTPTEGTGVTPDGSVVLNFGDGTPVNTVSCAAALGNTCTAAVSHTYVLGGDFTISASYTGGTHHDPSNGTLSQTVITCTANPVVTNSDDDGAGSLRQALADACGSAGHNLITFDTDSVTSPITLTSGELVPARDVTVQWTGGGLLEITRDSSAPNFRIFHVTTGRTVTLETLKISNGDLTLLGSSGKGGGILNEGSLTILESLVSGNTVGGSGAGIANTALTAGTTATLLIQDTTVSDNSSADYAGGILNLSGDTSATASTTIVNSLIAQNEADNAAGVVNDGGGGAQLTVTNSTISGNVAGQTSGGLYNAGTATLTGVTVTANISDLFGFFPLTAPVPGGIVAFDGSLTLNNTIVAGNIRHNVGSDDILGALDSASANNLIGDGSNLTGVTDGTNGNQIGTAASPIDAKLGPLGNYGGRTQTHVLLPGSPAIDAGDNALAVVATDQRGTGFARIADGPDSDATATVDIGAFELGAWIDALSDLATAEDVAAAVVPINAGDAALITSVTATSDNTALVPNDNAHLALTGSGGSRQLTVTPAANQFGTAHVTVTASGSGFASSTFLFTVTPVADTPSITDAVTNEDTQTTSGLVVSRNPGDGAEVDSFKVTGITGGRLFLNDGTSEITNGTWVSFLAGSAGLKFTPDADSSVTGHFSIQAGIGGIDAGLGGAVVTATITVNPVADTPSVTNATTTEDAQTASGLVVTRNPVDGAEVTHYRITNITHGTVFLADGTTAVGSGGFITVAQGAAGLKFTPASNFFGTASFDLQASTSASAGGLGGAIVTATITVSALADTPSVTPATTKAQVKTTSGLVITPNAGDGAEVTHFKITSITSGTLYQADGTTAIAGNAFITAAQGAAGLKFMPDPGFAGTASFQVQASLSNADAGLGGGVVTANITVNKHTTTTTLVSANPNPSDKTQPIPVIYTVVSADGGPTPTGTVTVAISGGTETCTGTVAAGQCTLTPTSAGARTITAAYAGDAINLASAGGPAAHTVNACTADPVVITANPSGTGSLEDAVATACFGSTITFSIPGAGPHTITLNNFTLDIAKAMTIRGSSDGVRISGNHLAPIAAVELGVTAVLDGLTLTDGYSTFGGALTNAGSLTIRNSTLSGNVATIAGGAIDNNGTLTVVNSTISGNSASQSGGGIMSVGAPVALTHVTITGNTSAAAFGGVAVNDATIANSVIAGNQAPSGADGGENGTDLGGNILSGDPMLGPLQDNGGPTFTHKPLPGSPALDAGDNTIAANAGLTTDQRGPGFARVLDSADADTTQTVDAGAVEADAIVQVLTDQAIDEDGSVQFTFNVGDATTAFDSIVAASNNTTLLPNLAANVNLTGTDSTRTLTLTPVADLSGTAQVTVTATKTVGGVAQTSSTQFTLTVNAVNDPPTLNPISNPAAIAEDASQQTVNLSGISAGGGEAQTLTVTATSTNTALIPNPIVTYTSANATGSLAYTPVANKSGSAIINVTVSDGVLTATQTFTVVVNSVADTPSVNNVHALEDSPSDVIHITKNPGDGPDVTHYKITNITGGTLARFAVGQPAVNAGDFLTVAQGSAGLLFYPSANSNVTGHFTVQASIGATDAGLGGALVTSDITIDPVPDPPSITPTTTPEDTQSTTGLVITRNAVDGPEVTHFQILDIFHGAVFQHDGTTPIPSGTVITAAQGAAGLRFTPDPNFSGTADFLVIGVFDAAGTYNGSPGINAGIVTVTPVADTPSITGATTVVNAQTTAGLVVSRNAVDGVEVTHVQVTGITGGSLFKNDGVTAIGNGSFITIAEGAAGLRFTPAPNSATTGHVTIQASTSGVVGGLGGGTATASIVINPLVSTTAVVTSGSPSNPGVSVTFTATVTTAAPVPTGTMQFMDGATALGSPVALVNGVATFSTTTLATGAHAITAVYGGDSLHATSTGTLPGGQTVRTSVTVVVSSSGNPTPLAVPVTISATPTHVGSTLATGTITFTEGATTLATASLSAGSAAFTTSAFALGTHHLTAQYSGDGSYAPGSATFDQVTSCPVMTLGPATIPPAVLGVPYAVTFTQTGGVGATTFALTGTLPAGLTFAAPSATLSGVAQAPGTYPITVTATPANGCGAVTANYTLLVGGGRTVLTGADAGGAPHVRRFSALDGSAPTIGSLNSFFAFDALFTGGVRVAEGDVNGDGVPDYIVGAGPGRAPEVRLYDGATGTLRASFLAFEADFTGGVFVAAGDVNGDGYIDIVAGSGEGRSGEVKVFSGRDLSVLRDTFVYDRAFTGGVHVAAGDVNGDGMADLIVGTGPGAALVTVLDGADLSVLRTLTAYPGFTGGVWVAAGDVTGDGYADIVTGAGPGGAPHVRVFDGRTGVEKNSFFAYDAGFSGGVRVAAGDVTGDGHAEIITGAGPGHTAEVRVFDPVTSTLLSSTVAYTTAFAGGVFVATAAPASQLVIDGPADGASTLGTFAITGWAFEEGTIDAGISSITVTATRVSGGAPISLGSATLGDPRGDVGAIYGAAYAHAGFHLQVTGLAPGIYDLRATARSAVSGAANLTRTVRVTIRPEPVPLLAIDIPAPGRTAGGTFGVAGWALTAETLPAPGVDAVHVWAAPLGGGPWVFVGAAILGVPRPDVAAAFGPQYATAGYYLTVTNLAPGTWDLYVFPRRTGDAAFGAPRTVRVTVPGGTTRSILTGADAGGGPHARRFNAIDGGSPAVGPLTSFFAFDPSFTGGVRVAEGDVNGDGVPDYIAGLGPGGSPGFRIIDGATGAIRVDALAFEPAFHGGVFVAAGDVNGDGYVDAIVSSGPGRRGEIKVFSGRDQSLIRDLFVFDPAFTGGVHVAAGDVNGDGYADLIAGAADGSTTVIVFSGADLSVLQTLTPFPGFTGGIWVAAGDVTGDGFADVITGAGPGGGPAVEVFDGRTGVPTLNFFAYEPSFTGGVRVAAGDVSGDGRADVITGPGPGRAPNVRVFDGTTAGLISDVTPYGSSFVGGVFVATAVPVSQMVIDSPVAGATIAGGVSLTGWAFEDNPASAGIDAIHVWAYPVAGGAPIFAGAATLGDGRLDVAAIYGVQYAHAGFHLSGAALPPGTYDLLVVAHDAKTGTFNLQRVIRITVTP